jgi:sulfoxide reductase catalytic subunit YedY
MHIRRAPDVKSSEITPESLYLNRRQWLAAAGALGAIALAPRVVDAFGVSQQQRPSLGKPYGLQPDDEVTDLEDVTGFNNFYEFGTAKDDPKANSGMFNPKPWTIRVEGFVKKPADYQLEDFVKPYKLEDRIYRMRCVEGWSMVIPWRGFQLSELLKRVEPTSQAKFVAFETLYDPRRMSGQRFSVLEWPYLEGLRLDEAMNPLTLMVTGLYGKDNLPNQNGAPIRLVVPWKYGFKGIKSIVKIRLVDKMPKTAWNVAAPEEYGFYSNVNPEVDHPRWSQATERRIGEFARKKTLMFNGYTEQVGSMYAGMDLRKNY